MKAVSTTAQLEPGLLGEVNETLKQVLTELKNRNLKDKKFLNIDEAVEYTGIAKGTFYHLTSKNEIPFRKPAKRIVFVRQELDEWMMKERNPNSAL